MAVSEDDVRHVASLARLGVEPARIPSLVSELNGILVHMAVLAAVDTAAALDASPGTGVDEPPGASRADASGASVPLAAPREEIAPEMRDGFFLVPRLATHEGEGDRAP